MEVIGESRRSPASTWPSSPLDSGPRPERTDGGAGQDRRAGSARPEPAILTLEGVDLGVAFGPLLRREVRVTRVVLDRPELTLVKDSTGRLNTAPRPRPNGGSTPGPGGAVGGGRGGAAGGGAALGGGLLLAVPSAEIRHGRIHFVDEATRARYQVEDLDGTIEARLEPDTVRIRTDLVLGGVRADLKAEGGATYGPLTIGLRGRSPMHRRAGRPRCEI